MACLIHLREDDVSSLQTSVREFHGIVERGVLAKSYDGSRLGDGKVFRVFVEIGLGSALDTNGIVEEIKIVEIHGDDFLLGVGLLQFHGDDPFDGFLEQALQLAVRHLRIELLGQLLSDGRATSGTLVTHDTTLDDGPGKCLEVDARMLIESLVLCRHQCMDDMGRYIVVGTGNPIVSCGLEDAHEFSVGREHL